MSKSNIEWTDEVWNPVTGCNKVSAGCKNCYAEVMHRRLQKMYPEKYSRGFTEGPQLHDEALHLPLTWKRPRKVFVNSMSDLFHEDVSFDFIDAVFSVMSSADHHTYQVLTKRAWRMYRFWQWKDAQMGFRWKPKPNIWIGVSVENQQEATDRIIALCQIDAHVRFLSCEPLLGPLDIYGWLDSSQGIPSRIDWVIAGGESGPNARPMHPDWVRSLRDQCKAADVPFFFKQWGEWGTEKLFHGKKKNIKGTYLNINGHRCGFESLMDKSKDYITLWKTGKNNNGNFLDGVQHLEFPSSAHHQIS